MSNEELNLNLSYSVGRVPRKLLMKYLGVKMYLIRLKQPTVKVSELRSCADLATMIITASTPASGLLTARS